MKVRALLSRIRGSFASRRSEEDDEELQAHLAMLAERFERQGMSSGEAAYAAKRQFGGVTRTKENLRERRALLHFDVLLQDLKHAFRQIKGAPGFTATAALTLALGIGATTAVFAVVYVVLLQPLPYVQPNRLVLVEMQRQIRGTHGVPNSLSYPNFFDLRANNRVFEHMVSFRQAQFTLSDTQPAINVDGEIVSWDLFPLLGIRPALGRGFLPGEERAGTHAVILSHELWQSRFGGQKNIIGRSIRINGKLFTVDGVAPAGSRFPPQNPNVQLWVTLSEDLASYAKQRGAGVLDAAMARLKPGVTLQQAQAQMDSVAGALAKEYPDSNRNMPATYVRSAFEILVGHNREPILILLGAVGLLLLIACANVANLLLARSAERGREFALRAALGASRPALIRQLLVESLALGLLGSGGGVLLAFLALYTILPFAGTSIPRIMQAGLNGYVLVFCVGLAIVTSVLFSLAPAIHVARSDLAGSLKAGAPTIGRGHDRLRSVLVVAQICLGLVLLSGAGLLITSFLHLERHNPGFQPNHLLTFNINAPGLSDATKQIAFSDRLLQRLRTIPGVSSAAIGRPIPLTGIQISASFNIEERPKPPWERPHSSVATVTPGYFETLSISMLRGRAFSERDNANSPPVLIVNQAFAKRYFPGEDAIGKRIEFNSKLREIVGVVGNATQRPLNPEPDPIYYFPYKQLPWGIGTIILRTSVPPLRVESAARVVVSKMGKAIPVYRVRTMGQVASTVIAGPRFQTLLLTSFSAIALLLTAVGLYGVLAYSVTRRRRELGIRLALGAERTNVVGLVMRQAMLLVVIGIGFGIAGALASTRLLRTMIYGASPNVWLLLAVACAVLVITGLIAAFVPARRAASVNPMEALRSE
ncbi:MAG TPA: ABC transporter permease [Bryobacteraceae bacterium]